MEATQLKRPAPPAPRPVPRRRRSRLGGVDGNERLTIATAVLLTLLLAAEGLTILRLGGRLLTVHMFIGLLLLPPVALKLASTGYRFARYYTGARAYREKGPPLLPLRMLAPLLVLATFGVFASGVWLMLLRHKSDTVLFIHKASFIVWGVVFAVHFLSYLPRVVSSLRAARERSRAEHVPGSGVRAALVAACLGAGVALAISLLPVITSFSRGF